MTSFKLALAASLFATQSLCAINAYGQDLNPAVQEQALPPVLRGYGEAVSYVASFPLHTPLGAAWQLKLNSDEANARDLANIWSGLAGLIHGRDVEALYSALKDKAEADRAAFKAARDCHTAEGAKDTAWSYALGSSIGKILGTDKISGLLDDMLTQFNATIGQGKVFSGNMADLNPAIPNEVVQFKMLGIYLHSILEGKPLEEILNDKIFSTFYPNYYDHPTCAEPLKSTLLYGDIPELTANIEGQTPALQMPTMGFVWGGNAVSYYPENTSVSLNTNDASEETFKPFFMGDASSFVSATNRWDEIRIATYFMCLAAQVHQGKKALTDIDAGDAGYVKTFLPLAHPVPLEEIQPGDTLLWCPGFTALFAGWADETKENAWIISMNRSDEKDMEGIDVRKRLLHAVGKETIVFRSQVPSSYLFSIAAREEDGTCLSISAQGNVTYTCVPPAYGAQNPWPVPPSAHEEL